MKTNLTFSLGLYLTILLSGFVQFSSAAKNLLLPEGLIFRVQGILNSSEISEVSNQFFPVNVRDNNLELGVFTELSEAIDAKHKLESAGLTNSDIIVFYKQEKIETSQLKAIQAGEHDGYQSVGTMSIKEMEQLMKLLALMEYHYTVTFPIQVLNDQKMSFLNGKMERRTNAKGIQMFSFGKFDSLESATAFADLLRSMGIENTGVTAWNSSMMEQTIEQAYNFEMSAYGK